MSDITHEIKILFIQNGDIRLEVYEQVPEDDRELGLIVANRTAVELVRVSIPSSLMGAMKDSAAMGSIEQESSPTCQKYRFTLKQQNPKVTPIAPGVH